MGVAVWVNQQDTEESGRYSSIYRIIRKQDQTPYCLKYTFDETVKKNGDFRREWGVYTKQLQGQWESG